MIQKVKTDHLFVPIARTEEHEDYTIVEGHAYVNSRVKSDRYNLLRSTMESMVGGWMTDGPSIKEMHRAASSAGVGIDQEWDDKGLKITAKIVDTEARKKVKHGVYRGFSVGVIPTKLRGDDVLEGRMPEISLVDRPADPEARFACVRSEDGLPDEVDADVIEDDRMERADVERDYILRSDIPAELERLDFIARAAHVEEIERRDQQISTLQSERDEATGRIHEKEGEIARLSKDNDALRKTSVAQPPTRFPDALKRQFTANQTERTEADEARDEIARIDGLSPEELKAMPESERSALATKRLRLESTVTHG
jgi:hypothetical protein